MSLCETVAINFYMNKRTKKIIAREFLILLGTSLLYLIILFSWVMLNNSNYDKKYQLEQRIEKLTEYEKLPYRLRVFYYINNEILKMSWEKMKDSKKFILDIKDEVEASKTYNYIKNNSDITIDKKEFISRISKDNQSEKYLEKIIPLEKELKKRNSSFFSNSITDKKVIGLGIILWTVFFLFRYLFYITKWSIKQLRL